MFIEYLVNNGKQPHICFYIIVVNGYSHVKRCSQSKLQKKKKTLTLHTIEPLEYDQAWCQRQINGNGQTSIKRCWENMFDDF